MNIAETDTLFSLVDGGDFLRSSYGVVTKNKAEQLVKIVGYSKNWKSLTDAVSTEDEELKKIDLKLRFTDPEQKAVALFYDENSKEREEIVLINPQELSQVINLEKQYLDRIKTKSLLLDKEVALSLFKILFAEEL